ncbi:hypothetical protein NODU109028_17515 [Nocardioides dubius]
MALCSLVVPAGAKALPTSASAPSIWASVHILAPTSNKKKGKAIIKNVKSEVRANAVDHYDDVTFWGGVTIKAPNGKVVGRSTTRPNYSVNRALSVQLYAVKPGRNRANATGSVARFDINAPFNYVKIRKVSKQFTITVRDKR